jgi:hypothetical protein
MTRLNLDIPDDVTDELKRRAADAGLRKRKANGDELTDEEETILELAHERTGAWLRERGKLGENDGR